ncbi:hypothetical protein CGCF413_v014488 [Colletotrichum fructicola]|nr:hypothetical protein CGCF413_v014488 [Colletotrichum fructicola]
MIVHQNRARRLRLEDLHAGHTSSESMNTAALHLPALFWCPVPLQEATISKQTVASEHNKDGPGVGVRNPKNHDSLPFDWTGFVVPTRQALFHVNDSWLWLCLGAPWQQQQRISKV